MTTSSIYTRNIAQTGERLTIGRPAELGIDADTAWVTVCEDHGTIATAETRAIAYKTRGNDFCDDCRARGPKAAPAKVAGPKVDLSKKTQRAAYKQGFNEALAFLVTVLEEQQDVNGLIDAIEDNADADTRARLQAYYAAKNTLKGLGL